MTTTCKITLSAILATSLGACAAEVTDSTESDLETVHWCPDGHDSSTYGGRDWSFTELAWLAGTANAAINPGQPGLPCGEGKIATAVAIAQWESQRKDRATNDNCDRTGASSDRGLWQINTIHAGTVARVCGNADPETYYDPTCNAKAMIEISGTGGNFNPWYAYTGHDENGIADGNYLKSMREGNEAEAAVCLQPGGSLDQVAYAGEAGGQHWYSARGWAMDPNTSNPPTIRLFISQNGGGWYGLPDPMVAQGPWNGSGFTYDYGFATVPGHTIVCAHAVDFGPIFAGQPTVQLGCKEIWL